MLGPRSEPVLGTPGIEDDKASIQIYSLHTSSTGNVAPTFSCLLHK